MFHKRPRRNTITKQFFDIILALVASHLLIFRKIVQEAPTLFQIKYESPVVSDRLMTAKPAPTKTKTTQLGSNY